MSKAPSPPEPHNQSVNGNYIAQAANGSTAIVTVFQSAQPRAVDPVEVAAAEAHLEALPLDTPSERIGLLPPYIMPWLPNRFFVGREDDLLALARALKGGRTAAIGQSPAVTGMGGQGKTQLAVEFAYRYSRWFRGGVFWVRCDDPATMAEAVAACGLALHPNDAGFSARPLPERVALVASAWASALPRLLIFDNCEDEAILDDWMPKGGGCRLLLTARRVSWSPARGIKPVPLGRLARSESIALLHRRRPDLLADDPDLGNVAAELGDLPLALDLAGSYLARYRHERSGTPGAYLVELHAQDLLAHISLTVEDPAAAGGRRSLTGHEQDVARTFEVSLRRLQPGSFVDAFARILFACAAWFEPGVPIPRRLLKLCVGVEANDADAGRRFADALARLLDLALVERVDIGPMGESGAVVLHRLLTAFARLRLDEARAARSAVENNIAGLADSLLLPNDPTPFRDWATHLVSVAHAAGRDRTETAIRLLNAAGNYSSMVADYETSAAMLEDAVCYATRELGINHLEVGRSLSNLGNVQQNCGNFAAAEESQTRALAIYERTHGSDHPMVAAVLINLGNVQRERGDLAGAENSLNRALGIYERIYGPDHHLVGRALGNLGIVQHRRGDLAAAEASQTRALAISKTTYGPDHPMVAVVLVNLGNVQCERGDLAAAETSQARALTIYEGTHGHDHPVVALVIGSLGNVQRGRGDLATAEASQIRALTIQERAYGPDHPEVARTLGNLGNVQFDLGHMLDARTSYARALGIFIARLGHDHSDTAQVRQMIARINRQPRRRRLRCLTRFRLLSWLAW